MAIADKIEFGTRRTIRVMGGHDGPVKGSWVVQFACEEGEIHIAIFHPNDASEIRQARRGQPGVAEFKRQVHKGETLGTWKIVQIEGIIEED